jgi:hypothetical protein
MMFLVIRSNRFILRLYFLAALGWAISSMEKTEDLDADARRRKSDGVHIFCAHRIAIVVIGVDSIRDPYFFGTIEPILKHTNWICHHLQEWNTYTLFPLIASR